MHKYNNQDHAMMTAMLTVENIRPGRRAFDIWQVNQDAEYHEEGEAGDARRLADALSIRTRRRAACAAPRLNRGRGWSVESALSPHA